MSCCMKEENWGSSLPSCDCTKPITSYHRETCSSFNRYTSFPSIAAFSVAYPSRPNCRTRDYSFNFRVTYLISSPSD